MSAQEFYLITFDTAHLAMRAQSALDGRVKYLVVPTPKAITTSCGISLKIGMEEREALSRAFREGLIREGDATLYRGEGFGPSARYQKEDTRRL